MKLKIFWQKECPKCGDIKSKSKELLKNKKNILVEFYDIETVDGLAEASFYEVCTTPAIILIDDKGNVVRSAQGRDMELISNIIEEIINDTSL